MDIFLQQLINGLSLGSIYALIALGYTMVYGIIKLINFAHGDIIMIGGYIGFAVATYVTGAGVLGFIVALIVAMIGCSTLGFTIERVAYRPLRGSSRIAALITAIGVSLLLEYVMMYFVTSEKRPFKFLPAGAEPGAVKTDLLKNIQLNIGNVTIGTHQIIMILIAVALMILLQFIVTKTRQGKAMRAVSLDMQAAQLMGIDVNRTISFTFILGSALAGAAGVLVAIYYGRIDPLMGIMPGLMAFVAAVFGGIGSIPGAMVGGMGIGLIEALVAGYGGSNYRYAVLFAVLIAVLIFRPTGLLGKATGEKV